MVQCDERLRVHSARRGGSRCVRPYQRGRTGWNSFFFFQAEDGIRDRRRQAHRQILGGQFEAGLRLANQSRRAALPIRSRKERSRRQTNLNPSRSVGQGATTLCLQTRSEDRMQSLFASLRICAARERSIWFSMCERRESSIFASWKAPCTFQWRRSQRASMTCRPINHWWSFAITALAVRWSSTFSETPALTMPSTSKAASKPGPARSTNRYGAIDSVHPKRKLATHAAD